MSTGIIAIMKQASMEAMNNAQICDLRYGKVISTSPLKVQVTSQLTIPSSMLVVSKHLTDYKVDMVIDVDNNDEKKTVLVRNALKTGDKVVLLRKQGGQSYFILDRI